MYRVRRILIAAVVVIVTGTLAGLVALWPDRAALPEGDTPPEELIDARIGSVERFQGEAEPAMGLTGESVRLEVEILGGPESGTITTIETPVEGYPEFRAGDRVKLAASRTPGEPVSYFVADFGRSPALTVLAALFIGGALALGRWQGLRSLVGLGLSLLVVTRFVVPGILTGRSPVAVALVGGLAVMILTLYLTHGVNEKTTTALVATTAALAVTLLLGDIFIDAGKITGYASEEANLARFAVTGLDLQGLVLAGLLIASLGVLDDVTVTQASTVFTLHDADPRQTWAQLTRRAMTVGRDHIASTINTLFLVYAGASLTLLVLFSTGGAPVGEIVNSEIVAEEIVKTMVGSLGLITAVPLTTGLAATLVAARSRVPAGAPGHADARAGPTPGAAPGTSPQAHRRAGTARPAPGAAPGTSPPAHAPAGAARPEHPEPAPPEPAPPEPAHPEPAHPEPADPEPVLPEDEQFERWVRFLRDGGDPPPRA